ncbi:MAG: hypothetical protein GF398_16510 [Chitinivibrionales bacterium]|nr:hypothetical protein [Chitinivibrionales bacterium]
MHVETKEVQHLFNISKRSNQFRLSGDGRMMMNANCGGQAMFDLPEADSLVAEGGNPYTIPVDCSKHWNDGGNKISSSGCGISFSPSGAFIVANNDPGHTRISVSSIDPDTRRVEQIMLANWEDWNAWAIDPSLEWTDIRQKKASNGTYYMDTTTYAAGVGISTLSNWSANSDKWTASITGWPREGRWLAEGSNVQSWNWERKECMPVTHYPAMRDTARSKGVAFVAFHGDFWLSAPEADIAPGYIDDFHDRANYQISETDTEVNPYPLAVDRRDFAHKRQYNSHLQSGSRLFITNEANERITVEIFDAGGRTLQRINSSQSSIRLPRSSLSNGLNLVRITAGTKMSLLRNLVIK